MGAISYARAATVLGAFATASIVAALVAYGAAAGTISTITVDTAVDEATPSADGKCSLREAITNANDNARTSPDCPAGSASTEDKILFALGSRATITLEATLPPVTDVSGLAISGRRAAVTVSGDDTVQVFQVGAGAELTLQNLTVADGSAGVSVGYTGGGVQNNGGTLTVDHATFVGNTAGFTGGAIENFNGATLTVLNSTFTRNSALQGGALYNNATMTITDSTLADNSAGEGSNAGFGGAVQNGTLGEVTINRSTFSNNSNATTSGFGGAIFNEGAVEVINATFAGNNNGGSGSGSGAIGNLQGTVAVTSSTFSNNGIRNQSPATTTLRNTILANVPSGNNCVETITDDGYNISDDETCNFTEATSRNDTPARLASTLTNNGGPTKTIALLKGSPALNAIPKGQSGCATATDRIATDQRGVKRPQGPACDIGAYEKKVKRRR